MEILPLDFQAFRRPSFPRASGALQSQPAAQRDVQGVVKSMFPRVQKSQPHRSVQHFEIALIERSQPQPFVGKNLADERPLAAEL